MEEASKIDRFLSKNTIAELSGMMPVIHSTRSYNIESLIAASGLKVTKCKHFDENLIYFFLGRAAYRLPENLSEPQFWELPTCFVFNDVNHFKVERTFPFDSGAFKTGLYPSYMDGMPSAAFEAQGPEAARRIVSAFFGNFSNYIRGKPKSRDALEAEHSLGPLDAEILAIQKLSNDGTPSGFDDRRFSIEIQVSDDIDFAVTPPSAVILPTDYLRDSQVQDVLSAWRCDIINYDTYSLSISLYYGIIFEKFVKYCRLNGAPNV